MMPVADSAATQAESEESIPRKVDEVDDEPAQNTRKILVVEPNLDEQFLLKEFFRIRLDCKVHAVSTVGEALSVASGDDFDFIISDLEKSGQNGITFLRELAARNFHVPLIFYTVYDDPNYLFMYLEYPYSSVTKPNHDQLLSLVSDVMSWPLNPRSASGREQI